MTDTAILPNSVQEALRAWDAAKTLRAFRVNSDGATQEEIYAAAFDLLRAGNVPDTFTFDANVGLTETEQASAHSIAFVARRNGWGATVQQHIHASSPEITIRKPSAQSA